MSQLVKMPNLVGEDLVGLRAFYDDVEVHVRGLRNLGVDRKLWFTIVVISYRKTSSGH